MTRLARWLAAAGLLAVSGCGPNGPSLVSGEEMSAFYSPEVVNYAAKGGIFPTAVYGNPFGPDADDALLEGMTIPPGFSPAVLTAIPKGEARNDGHLVLIFDPARLPGGRAACRAPERVALQPDGVRLKVQGAFCYDDEMASEAVLDVVRPTRPDDREFREALDLLLAVILKPYSEHRRDNMMRPRFHKRRLEIGS